MGNDSTIEPDNANDDIGVVDHVKDCVYTWIIHKQFTYNNSFILLPVKSLSRDSPIYVLCLIIFFDLTSSRKIAASLQSLYETRVISIKVLTRNLYCMDIS